MSRDAAKTRPSALLPHDVLGIVGKRGTGKSTEGKELAAAEVAAGARVAAFDYHDEWSRKGRRTDQIRLGPLRDRCTADELFRDPSLLDDARLSLAVVPSQDPRECARDFAGFCDLVLATGGVVAIADEVGVFSEYCAEDLNRLACQSRHESVPLVLLAQRMTQIPKTARTQLTRLVSFRQDNPDDLDALADLVGLPQGKAFAERVSRLARGQSEQWRDDLTTPTQEHSK